MLSLVVAYYQRRGEANLVRLGTRAVFCFGTMLQIALFSSAFAELMYVAGSIGRDYIDSQLVRCDELLGFCLPRVLLLAAHWPMLSRALALAYDTLFPQTVVVILILGFRNDRKPLDRFTLQFMVCALITLLVFSIFPAEGPFTAYGFEPSSSQASYLEQIHALRAGEFTAFRFPRAVGLVTFPSFHVIWALLLAMAFLHLPRLFVPFALLNMAVILSTMTTGWHYLSDVLAGIVVYAAALLVTRLLESWPATDNQTSNQAESPPPRRLRIAGRRPIISRFPTPGFACFLKG